MFRHLPLGALLACLLTSPAFAADCGNTAAGFHQWKQRFASTAQAQGVGRKGLAALSAAEYANGTIRADRNQKSFRYSLKKFMELRGAAVIVAQGRKRKAKNMEFYQSLEERFGVPSGVLIAIHGMETAFGRFMGDSNVVSAILTLTYDCRRSAFFQPHAIAALRLVDRDVITAQTLGARHAELGHTQFLPGNALEFGIDGNGDGRVNLYDEADALASTANYLRSHGWRRAQPYETGSRNFKVIQAWNAAGVYQQAIALMAMQIDAP